MNNWENTLDEFRKLGGTADNVILSEGVYGRGLFPKDSKLPVKIAVPKELLLQDEWLKFDENNSLILSDECDWSSDKKNFYLNYLRDFAFTAQVEKEIIQQQSEFSLLPESVKSMLRGFGFRISLFQKHDVSSSLEIFKKSRRLLLNNNKLVLMPLIELVNHDDKSKITFRTDSGVSISGKFSNEILINYAMGGDAISMYETFRFSTLKTYAFSGNLAINLGSKVIKIARYTNLYNKVDKTNIPKVIVQGNEINLSFLVVGSMNDRTSPKKIFLKLMANIGMPIRVADELFDGIVNMNRQFFNNLLKELEPLSGTVIDGLRIMAKNQLMAIGNK